MAFLVSRQVRAFTNKVATGLVDGVRARTTPAGRGMLTVFATGSRRGVTRSSPEYASRKPVLQARFLIALCSTTPNPVSSTVRSASSRALRSAGAGGGRSHPVDGLLVVAGEGEGGPPRSLEHRRPACRTSHRPSDRRARSRPRPPVAAGVVTCQQHRHLQAVEELLAEVGLHQYPGLELEDPRVERREDRPHSLLVEGLHHVPGALRGGRTRDR